MGRRVTTSITNFISNFSTSNVPSAVTFAGAFGYKSRIPLNSAPDESAGGPNETSGGLSIRILSVKGSFPADICTFDFLSSLGAERGFLVGFFPSFETRR